MVTKTTTQGKTTAKKRTMPFHPTGLLSLFTCAVLLSLIPSFADAQALSSIAIKVRTGNRSWSGTDDRVYFRMKLTGSSEERKWRLDNPDHDDFEKGHTDTFVLRDSLPDDVCQIRSIWITKNKDSWAGGWFLRGIEIYYNDAPSNQLYSHPNIKKWMEDNSRRWSPENFSTPECPAEPPPLVCPGTGTTSGTPTAILPATPGQLIVWEDSDRDCYPDHVEEACGTDPNNPDTDGDGIPDGFEDPNHNCIVDADETDATNSDSNGDGIADGMYDGDGDGLFDWRDPNPNNKDSDGDGWEDGPTNVRTCLELFRIECIDESFGLGADDVFVVVDDVRFPIDAEGLDGYFKLNSGEDTYPMVDVARRVHSASQSDNYQAKVELWDDDLFDFTDDFWWKEILDFREQGTFVLELRDDDQHYKLTFKAYRERFYDPNPAFGNADNDRDGILDGEEHQLSGDLRGLSDPGQPDIFLQLNWLGADQEPEPYSKIDVVSQFYYHGYPIHLDDGDFGGGGKLPYKEEVSMSDAEEYADNHLAIDRHGLFHFVLAVDVVAEYKFGVASGPSCNDLGQLVCNDTSHRYGLMSFKSDYLDHISDLESIVFMHELGHTLGLCHRFKDGPSRVVDTPRCSGLNPPQCDMCGDCSHYFVS